MDQVVSKEEVVLPDTLVAALVTGAAEAGDHIVADAAELFEQRAGLRKRLLNEQRIFTLNPGARPPDTVYAIDGAHVVSLERSMAYSASCAVCVGPTPQDNSYGTCLAVLPHSEALDTYSSALMIMQEIMLTVSCLELNPDALCLIDGSRMSAFIRVNQFYAKSGETADLEAWRKNPSVQPGKTIAEFDSRDWLEPYLKSDRIVGNLKLVSTNDLVRDLAPQWIGRYDDKTLAALVLGAREQLLPFPVKSEPLHMSKNYRTHEKTQEIARGLTTKCGNSLMNLFQIYFCTDEAHGVFKAEVNRLFLGQKGVRLAALYRWWLDGTEPVDLEEPYLLYVADRFAKEGVSVSSSALDDIVRRMVAEGPVSADVLGQAWNMTSTYRTQL